MKKFLFICETYPSGLNGTSLKTRGILKYLLSLGHHVDVLCTKFDSLAHRKLKHKNLRIFEIKNQNSEKIRFNRLRLIFKLIFSYKPVIVGQIFNKKIDLIFKGLDKEYDNVFFDAFSTLQYAHGKDNRYIYIENEDISYLMKKRIKWEKNVFKKIFYWTEFKRSLFFEKIKFSYIRQIWAVSNYGKKRLKETSSAKIFFMPTLISQQKNCFRTNSQNLIFVGTLSWRENYLGLKWFIKNCWLDIVNEFPDCKLIIVGQQGDESWEKIAEDYQNIEFKGFVNDLKPLFKSAAIAITPIFINVGIKIKVLTYLSYGIPTISTKISTGGMRSSKGILIANKNNFTKKIKQLLADQKLRQTLSREALANIKANHSEKVLATFFKKTKIFD